MVETGPRQVGVERDLKSLKIKIRKRVMWRRSRGARLGGLSRWFKWLKNRSQRKARAAWALVQKRLRGEDGSGFNSAIVAEIISCVIARNGKRSRKSSVPPWEKTSLAPSPIHMGSLGWNP